MDGSGAVSWLRFVVIKVFVLEYHVEKHAIHLMTYRNHSWTVVTSSPAINRGRCRMFKKASFPSGQKVKSGQDRRACGLRRGLWIRLSIFISMTFLSHISFTMIGSAKRTTANMLLLCSEALLCTAVNLFHSGGRCSRWHELHL